MKELLKFNFPSDLRYLDLIHQLTEKIVEELIPDGSTRYHLALAVSEAVTNAIEHGNQKDPSKDLILSFRYDGNTLKIEVEDQGKGFDLSQSKSHSKKEGLYQESGRGIFLIQAFMDQIKLLTPAGQGTKVQMTKYLKNPNSKNKKTLALAKKSSYNNH